MIVSCHVPAGSLPRGHLSAPRVGEFFLVLVFLQSRDSDLKLPKTSSILCCLTLRPAKATSCLQLTPCFLEHFLPLQSSSHFFFFRFEQVALASSVTSRRIPHQATAPAYSEPRGSCSRQNQGSAHSPSSEAAGSFLHLRPVSGLHIEP